MKVISACKTLERLKIKKEAVEFEPENYKNILDYIATSLNVRILFLERYI